MRKLAAACFAFSIGIFLSQYLLSLTWLLPLAGAFAVLSLAAFFCIKGERRTHVLIICISLSAALAYNYLYVSLVQLPNEALTDTTEALTLELCDYADATEQGAKATVRILNKGLQGKSLYYGSDYITFLEPGDRISTETYISSAATIRESDVTTFTSKGTYLLLYNRGEEKALSDTGSKFRYIPQRIAHRTQEVISSVFPERTMPLFRAILLGDRSMLTEEDSIYLEEAGILHITAVSGLHCAFLLSILTFIIGRHRRKLLSAVAIPLLCLYALMTGASPSVVRACVMLIMVLLAPLFERESDAPTSLSLALALILLANPFAAASISLQMSFASMSGILWLTPKLYAAIQEKCSRKWQYLLLGSFAVTAGALVFTAPLSAYYFGVLSLVTPLSNLLCLWAASAIFALGLVCTILGYVFVPLARLLAFLPHCGALYIFGVCRLFTNIPNHAVYFANHYLKYWLVYTYALFVVCYVCKTGKWRYGLSAVLSAVALVLTIYVNAIPFTAGTLHAVVLDVGQGQSIVLHAEDETALIDCGSSNSFISAGDVAADYLQSIGENEIDTLILTHYHADHINGVRELLARIQVDMMVLPDVSDDTGQKDKLLALAEQYDIEINYTTEVNSLPLSSAVLTVYPPVGEGSTNEACQSVVCSAGTFDLLVTADMDNKAEKTLTETYDLPDIEVLIVGHHGSKSSTSALLLEDVTPEVGVISVGSNNYGHPTDAALYRLSDKDIAVYRTDMQGNIHITVH